MSQSGSANQEDRLLYDQLSHRQLKRLEEIRRAAQEQHSVDLRAPQKPVEAAPQLPPTHAPKLSKTPQRAPVRLPVARAVVEVRKTVFLRRRFGWL
jgi:hypothetical protein